jgi:glycosyltransferase involved in cell wall biosynthesis
VKIAILGTRGIPANYGGFETFAEECAAGLAQRAHDVTVYCRSHYVDRSLRSYRNVRLIVLPTLHWKYTDTIVHSFLSVLHALGCRYDVVLICNAINSLYAFLPRLFGTPVVINVDGIERKRQKWGWAGKSSYRISEQLSAWLPDRIVTDARVMQSYYREKYGVNSTFIPYGAPTERITSRKVLDSLGLSPDDYFLYVSRLEPENNAHLVIEAFEAVRTSRRLVIVGDAPYSKKYIARLHRTRDPRILFPGAIYGAGYWELQAHSFCYIHATEVGGTHPALIEAMGQGNLVVATCTPENEEVLANTGVLFRTDEAQDLTRRLQDIVDNPENFKSLRGAAQARVRAEYTWEKVVTQYEQLFTDLLK